VTGADPQTQQRMLMVDEQIMNRGVRDQNVLAAMRAVPRHLFVPAHMRDQAYRDAALGIAAGQTISQPYMVAFMTELLALDVRSRVLEIGTGSGYQTAVLAELAGAVYSIERLPELSAQAGEVLFTLGYHNVELVVGDGSLGLPDQAPFDAIVVTAAAPQAPPALLEQLADKGRLVVPIGPAKGTQMLTLVVRDGQQWIPRSRLACRFVPLIGGQGFDETDQKP
jgi:protein-L-isoaspartate(D-aspartate) O-methyltransferase